ncbi:MAG: hypothetical protein PHQ23_13625 [Candidatus Wallbacteria bacterium]|nr:hypothetical protein [Candidatus Wallbacteria bacterium]
MNVYREILSKNLNRLHSFFEMDCTSPSYGMSDRLFWGWKLRDYPNGAAHGGIHALSVALRLRLAVNPQRIAEQIYAAFEALPKVTGRDGSLVESFPGESSFCVTAAAASDALSCMEHLRYLKMEGGDGRYFSLVAPLIEFLNKSKETHGLISNHLAAAVSALVLWNRLTGEKSTRYQYFLERIIRNQSREGWYLEYDGPDPGYQTLCTDFLSDVHRVAPCPELAASLKSSAKYLAYFIHPDGTTGGLYGSRNTEVYYPGGVLALSPLSCDFALFAREMERGIAEGRHVLPQDIDTENFIPLLNSYARAALKREEISNFLDQAGRPWYERNGEIDFPDSGIFVKSSRRYFAVVNYRKNGTIKVFNREREKIDIEDGGIFGKFSDGRRFSTQYRSESSGDFSSRTINCGLCLANDAIPGPFSFLMIRLMALTVFRFGPLLRIFKKIIVRLLITGKHRLGGKVTRRFEFFDDRIEICETIIPPRGCKVIGHFGKCRATHMASSGYFTGQMLEKPEKSELVTFR